jgi:hypothetical protein
VQLIVSVLIQFLLCPGRPISDIGTMASDTANRGPQIFAVNVCFGVTAVLIVLLRIYTRALIVKAFGLDDWLIILATVCACKNQAQSYGRLANDKV